MGRAEYWSLLQGAWVTVAISLAALAIGTPSGLLLAIVRWRGVPVLDRVVATLVSLLRATPSVTLVLLVYFALPTAGVELSRFWAAVGHAGARHQRVQLRDLARRRCSPFPGTSSTPRPRSA